MYKCSSKRKKNGGQKSDEVGRSSSKKRAAPSSSSSANNSHTRMNARIKRLDLPERSGSKSPTEYCKRPDMEKGSMISGNAPVGKDGRPWRCKKVQEFMTAHEWIALSENHNLDKNKNKKGFPIYVAGNQFPHLHIKKNKGGNSNKYLMKINKIKETLKLLKKNKVKNKVKITKLNKSIEGLKKKENVKRKKTKA